MYAAILSGKTIRIWSRSTRYDQMPICIKDWITQANFGHDDRFTQPENVQIVPRR